MRNPWLAKLRFGAFFFLAFLVMACQESVPKPRAYFRIEVPDHQFIPFDTNYPFRFDYADYAVVSNAKRSGHPYWLFVDYPQFDARIYLTYNDINGNMNQMLEDAHDLAYKHISVANDIRQQLIFMPQEKVYGLFYHIKGAKVASPINFFLTDSTHHFLRGSLYFDMIPQNDSLQPVIDGIEKDIQQMIKSFSWKELPHEKSR
jgi:gliding motility-associated lipoprotein GldD